MIRLLEGTLRTIHSDALTLMVSGVGYLVYTPNPHGFTPGESLTLHTHHAVRETASDLYGFSTDAELILFELLLKVPKIGPKSALGVMANATPTLLIESITRNDAVYLQKMSSVGKKTCENIVNQLHGKLPPELEGTATERPSESLSQTQADAVDALVSLGYSPASARDALQSIPDQTDATTVNQLVTYALKQIT